MRKKQAPADKSKPKPTRTTAKKVQREAARTYVPTELPEVEIKAEDDDHEVEQDGLSPRRRLFVEALAGPCMGSATRAAMMAGYSTNNYQAAAATASRLLNIVKVQESLSQAMARRRAGPEWTKNRIVELASSSMANVVTVGADGKMNFDARKAQIGGALGQLKELKPKVIEGGDGMEPVVIEMTIKIHDPMPALRLLAEMHGLIDSGGDTAKPPEDIFYESAGQAADKLPTGAMPGMPDDVFDVPRVAGGTRGN